MSGVRTHCQRAGVERIELPTSGYESGALCAPSQVDQAELGTSPTELHAPKGYWIFENRRTERRHVRMPLRQANVGQPLRWLNRRNVESETEFPKPNSDAQLPSDATYCEFNVFHGETSFP